MPYIKTLTEHDFVCLHTNPNPKIGVDLVYAQVKHPDNMFVLEENGVKVPLYKPDAVMSVHHKLWDIVLRAVELLPEALTVVLKDSLRTTDAQKRMGIIKDQNKWPDNLVSPAGVGGHPRGMAIDLMVCESGKELDVGTSFDFFDTVNTPPRSSRFSPHLTTEQRANQKLMEQAIIRSSLEQGQIILPLLDEHWDYRFASTWSNTKDFFQIIIDHLGRDTPDAWDRITISNEADFHAVWDLIISIHQNKFEQIFGICPRLKGKDFIFINDYAPVSDSDLPPFMRLCS